VQQPLKSVSASALKKAAYRVNKLNRYEGRQKHQQKLLTQALDPSFYNPMFFDQYTPPAESLEKVAPGWYKQHNQTLTKNGPATKAQSPVTRAQSNLPIRSPPQSPKSPKLPHMKFIKRPEPKQSYLKQVNQAPRTLESPRQLLVILDLNGTLLYRKQRGGNNNYVARPRVDEFLHYLIANHKVMVWSSAKPENVGIMCERLFTPEQREQLVGVWGRDKLRLTAAQYNQKVQVYKQLTWVWNDHIVASSALGTGREWSQENTVLIDDSEEKAASEPYNILKIDEFEGKAEQMEADVLGQVVNYLDLLKWERDVSAYMSRTPFEYDETLDAYDWMPIVNDMH